MNAFWSAVKEWEIWRNKQDKKEDEKNCLKCGVNVYDCECYKKRNKQDEKNNKDD